MNQASKPSPTEAAEARLLAAVEQARAEGWSLTSGTFGAWTVTGGFCDPLGALVVTSGGFPKESYAAWSEVGARARALLGWNSDQMWAFCAGFDGYSTGPYFTDPRALANPEILELGRRLRRALLGASRGP